MKVQSDVLAEAVTAFCERRFTEVRDIAGLASGPLSVPSPRRADLAIEPHCLQLLTSTDPPLAGAGVVVAPYVLSDEPYWLEWWLAGPNRLEADTNPDSVTFRDYTSLVWFDEPQRTGERCITGPYVDYLCTDQYTLTFTAPLVDGDRFLGVAGVDVLARWFEQHLFVLLDARGDLDEGCVVVNRAGRVVACPSGAWVTGDLIRDLAADASPSSGWDLVNCPGTPFVVARKAA
jgi:hypothetical protein